MADAAVIVMRRSGARERLFRMCSSLDSSCPRAMPCALPPEEPAHAFIPASRNSLDGENEDNSTIARILSSFSTHDRPAWRP
jgi:hypothetical protein